VRSLRRALIALGAIGAVAGAVPLALALAEEGGHQRWLIAVTGPLIGWAFIGTGIYAWLREPDNRFGALMTAVGFSGCLAGLRVATEPWVFIIGLLFITSQWALLYHMLLAFPGGTLRNALERLLVAAMYFSAWVLHPVQVLFQDTTSLGLPENPLLVSDDRDLSVTLSRSRFWLALVLLVALGVILVRRWTAASRSQRQALAPVLISGGLVMALLALWYAALLLELDADLVDTLEDARYVVMCTVPFAFLAGLLRSRVAGAAAVSWATRASAARGCRRRSPARSPGRRSRSPSGGPRAATSTLPTAPSRFRPTPPGGSRSRSRRATGPQRCSPTTNRARTSATSSARSARPRC
jgi:hypothetical protein